MYFFAQAVVVGDPVFHRFDQVSCGLEIAALDAILSHPLEAVPCGVERWSIDEQKHEAHLVLKRFEELLYHSELVNAGAVTITPASRLSGHPWAAPSTLDDCRQNSPP